MFKSKLNASDKYTKFWDYSRNAAVTMDEMISNGDLLYDGNIATVKTQFLSTCYFSKSLHPEFASRMDFYKYTGFIRPDMPIECCELLMLGSSKWDSSTSSYLTNNNKQNITDEMAIIKNSDWAKLTGSVGIEYNNVSSIQL